MAQVSGSLPPVWATWIEFLAPGLAWCTPAAGAFEGGNQLIDISILLSLSSCLSINKMNKHKFNIYHKFVYKSFSLNYKC